VPHGKKGRAAPPDPRLPSEEDARHRVLVDALAHLASDGSLRDELAEICSRAPAPTDTSQIGHWAIWDPAGQKVVARVQRLLAQRGLPPELSEWALTLGVTGTANPALVHGYLPRVAPAYALETEPLTGQIQIVLRVPLDWSARRVDAWVRRAHARLGQTALRGKPVYEPSQGGRPPKLARAAAIGLARQFDTELKADWERATPRRVAGMGRDDWIAEFQNWLDRQFERHSAEHLWKTSLRGELRAGRMSLSTLDLSIRAAPSPRRPGAPSRRQRPNR
jgi:hypothetical protein